MFKRSVLLIFFVFISWGFSSVLASQNVAEDWYKDKEVVGFKFKGLHAVSPSDLLSVFGKYKGKPFTDDL